MSSAAVQRIIRAAIQTKQFAPAYYLHGEDDYLKEEAVRDLVDAVVDPATRDFNLEIRRGAELSAELLGSLLGTPPMMAERRALVVRDAGALKKDARAQLEKHLASPPPDVVVLLVAPAGAKADKGLEARCESLEFAQLSSDRVLKWIVHHASSALGTSITPEAASLLQSAVGDDLPQLALELEKLASFGSGAAIDDKAVAAVVGVHKEETLGAFLDAVASRDAARALALLPGVLQQPKTSAVMIVMALAAQTIAIAWAQEQRARGTPQGRLQNELFNLLKGSGGVVTGRPWGEAVAAWAQASGKWSADALDDAIETLLAADRSLKESRLSSDEQLLATVVLTLCGSRPASARGARQVA